MKYIDSKKNQLTLPEIIGHFVMANGLTGEKAAVQMLTIMEEMRLPDAEGINIGNTVFISHYTKDKKSLLGWIANVDTEKNLVNNAESYIRYLIDNDVEVAFFGHPSADIKPLTKRLEEARLGRTKTKMGTNGIYITEVKLVDDEEVEEPEAEDAGV